MRYSVLELKDKIRTIHDRDVNQKYGKDLPYSFHLNAVEAQGFKFKELWEDLWINKFHRVSESDTIPLQTVDILDIHANSRMYDVMAIALNGHDLIEDARMTWNDVKDLIGHSPIHSYATLIADIIYDVTDEKGKSRTERKSNKYYEALEQNPFAIFVKLADIAANTLFSKLTNSSMYEKYKIEFTIISKKIYKPELEKMFNYVESL